MPVWLLTLIPPVINLIAKLVDKYVPDKVTRKKEFKSKKKCVEAMSRFEGWTQEQLADYERERQRKIKARSGGVDNQGNFTEG